MCLNMNKYEFSLLEGGREGREEATPYRFHFLSPIRNIPEQELPFFILLKHALREKVENAIHICIES